MKSLLCLILALPLVLSSGLVRHKNYELAWGSFCMEISYNAINCEYNGNPVHQEFDLQGACDSAYDVECTGIYSEKLVNDKKSDLQDCSDYTLRNKASQATCDNIKDIDNDGKLLRAVVVQYNYPQANCGGDMDRAEIRRVDLTSTGSFQCNPFGSEETRYAKYTCNGDLTDPNNSDETMKLSIFKDNTCLTYLQAQIDISNGQCVEMQTTDGITIQTKFYFDCKVGAEKSGVADDVKGMIGVDAKFRPADRSDCSALNAPVDPNFKLYWRADTCIIDSTGLITKAECDADDPNQLKVTKYSENTCTTPATGNAVQVWAEGCYEPEAAFKKTILGCSGASHLTLFALAVLGFLRI